MEGKSITIPPPPPPLLVPAQRAGDVHRGAEDAVAIPVPVPKEEESTEVSSTELPTPATTPVKVSNINKKPISDLTILGFKLPSFKDNPSMRIKFLIVVIISVYLLFYILQVTIQYHSNIG